MMHTTTEHSIPTSIIPTATADTKFKIINDWQSYPPQFPLHSKFTFFMLTACSYFNKNFCIAIFLSFLGALSTLLISMISSFLFTHLNDANQPGYSSVCAAFLFFLIGSSIFSFANDLYIKYLNVKIISCAWPALLQHVLNLPLDTLKKYTSTALVQRLIDYEATIATLISFSLSVLFSVISLILLFIFMLFCNSFLAFLYLIICIIFSGIKLFLFPKSIKTITKQLDAQNKLAALLNQSLLQIHKIRSANIEVEIYNKWLDELLTVKNYEQATIKIEILTLAIESLIPVTLMLSFYFILYLTKSANISFLLPFIICAAHFTAILEKLSLDMFTLMHSLPGLKRIQPLIKEKIEQTSHKKILEHVNGDISFQNISLRHADNQLILDNLSLEVKPGQFVALIGASGAGKSSLFRLLLGFESPNSGRILIDNEDIQNLNLREFRKQLGIVLQTSNLFPGTIYSNIAVNSSITLSEAWRLAAYVGLDQEIENMPMKMYTHISDNAGESISGGQKQKILIARALATQPKLLLLDEATSALDNHSQALIYENLKKLNITRFVIAHRHSTIMDADIIFVLDKGKIIQSGKYNEIMQVESQ